MFLHRLKLWIGLVAFCATALSPFLRAESPGQPASADFSAARERFNAIRTSAMGYAYYLRSAYLRHSAVNPRIAAMDRATAREAVLSSVVYLKRALVYAPDSTYLWWEYAALNNGLGRVEDAIDAYEHLVLLDPGSSLHTRLGVLYELRNEPDKAVAHYRKAREYAPADAVLAERIADVYVDTGFKSLQRGDAELAREQLRQALSELDELVASNPEIRLLVKQGLIFETLDRSRDALRVYRDAIALDPVNSTLYIKASRMLFSLADQDERSGNIAAAEQHYQEAASLVQSIPPDHRSTPELLNYSAYVFALGGTNLPAAEELATRALKLDQSNGAYIDTLGWIYFRQGKFEQALQKVLRARELEGDDPVIMEHLGDIYLQLGQPDKAREMWLNSLRLDAENKDVQRKIDDLP